MHIRQWHSALRRYVLAVAGLNLAWEIVQLPLYTIWRTGSTLTIVVALAHCTAGDLVIAIAALTCALVLFGTQDWPARRDLPVAVLAIAAGLTYTIVSERLNVARNTWGYSQLMPIVPMLNVGLAPLLQWIAVPDIGLWWASRVGRK